MIFLSHSTGDRVIAEALKKLRRSAVV